MIIKIGSSLDACPALHAIVLRVCSQYLCTSCLSKPSLNTFTLAAILHSYTEPMPRTTSVVFHSVSTCLGVIHEGSILAEEVLTGVVHTHLSQHIAVLQGRCSGGKVWVKCGGGASESGGVHAHLSQHISLSSCNTHTNRCHKSGEK